MENLTKCLLQKKLLRLHWLMLLNHHTHVFFFSFFFFTLVKNDKKKFYQFPINPYGKAKKMAEDIILDFSKTNDMAIMILRFVTVSNKLY